MVDATQRRCRVCGGTTTEFDRATVLGHVAALYSRCTECWAILAEDPTWLPEAYAEAIATRDIGLVTRNLVLADTVEHIALRYCQEARTFLDFGAGNGLFVRMMRDRGLPFEYHDPFGPNLFAQGFEATTDPPPSPDIITMIEVIEHLVDPVGALLPFVESAQCIVISTTLVPEHAPPLDEWWYYSLDSGQHITILSERSLAAIASAWGDYSVSTFGTTHVFTRKPIPHLRFRLEERVPALWKFRGRRASLLGADYEARFGSRLD